MAKKVYIGAPTSVTTPGATTTYSITASNISTYFTVSNGSYYFAGSGSVFTSNNAGVKSSTATTTLTAKKAGTLSFDYSYSSESKYDLFTLVVKGTIVEDGVSGSTTTDSWSGSIAVGDIISFTYEKDSSQDKYDDECAFSNMKLAVQGAGTTSTKQSIARKVKAQYIGVSSKARKVKKGYIGVGGVARPFIGGGDQVVYYGSKDMSSNNRNGGAASVGNYALFMGGFYSKAFYDTVVSYSSGLVVGTAPSLTEARVCESACAGNANYAIALGGETEDYSAVVDAYSKTLTRTRASDLSEARLGYAVSNGSYVLLGGGDTTDSDTDAVDAYNLSLTRSMAPALSDTASIDITTGANNGYMFFAGVVSKDSADVYTSTLAKTSSLSFSERRRSCGTTNAGDYVIFAGGRDSAMAGNGVSTSSVDAFNKLLVRTAASNLSYRPAFCAGASLGDFGIIAGGRIEDDDGDDGDGLAYANCYNSSLVRSTLTNMSVRRYAPVSTSVGDYALIAFGSGIAGENNNSIDIYTFN